MLKYLLWIEFFSIVIASYEVIIIKLSSKKVVAMFSNIGKKYLTKKCNVKLGEITIKWN